MAGIADTYVGIENLVNLSGFEAGRRSGIRSAKNIGQQLHEFLPGVETKQFGLWNLAAAIYGVAFNLGIKEKDMEGAFQSGLKKINIESKLDFEYYTDAFGIHPIWAMAMTHVAATARNLVDETNPHFKFYDPGTGESDSDGTVLNPVNFYITHYIAETLGKRPELSRLIPDVFVYVLAQQGIEFTTVGGIEALGLDIMGAVAYATSSDRLIVRKAGSTAGLVYVNEYLPEYLPYKKLEVQIRNRYGMSIVLFDNLIATGSTLEAAANAIEYKGGEIGYNIGGNRLNDGKPFPNKEQLAVQEQKIREAREAGLPPAAKVNAFMGIIGFRKLGGYERLNILNPDALKFSLIHHDN